MWYKIKAVKLLFIESFRVKVRVFIVVTVRVRVKVIEKLFLTKKLFFAERIRHNRRDDKSLN